MLCIFIFFSLLYTSQAQENTGPLKTTRIEDVAYQVAIMYTNCRGSKPCEPAVEPTYRCGGGLVTYYMAITAGSCFLEDRTVEKYSVRAGSLNIYTPGYVSREIDYIVIREDGERGSKVNNDLALVKVMPPFSKLSPKVSTAILAFNPMPDLRVGMKMNLSGWAVTEDEVKQNPENAFMELRTNQYLMAPVLYCKSVTLRTFYLFKVNSYENHMCTEQFTDEYIDDTLCNADHGSVLVTQSEIMYGVYRFKKRPCRGHYPMIFSKISEHALWLWSYIPYFANYKSPHHPRFIEDLTVPS